MINEQNIINPKYLYENQSDKQIIHLETYFLKSHNKFINKGFAINPFIILCELKDISNK